MYEAFEKLDGSHPWRDVSPDGYVDYPARHRPGGSVIYFNYALAAELGLIPRHHERRMTPRLERAILDAFALQIVNEYDQANPQRLKRARMNWRVRVFRKTKSRPRCIARVTCHRKGTFPS